MQLKEANANMIYDFRNLTQIFKRLPFNVLYSSVQLVGMYGR